MDLIDLLDAVWDAAPLPPDDPVRVAARAQWRALNDLDVPELRPRPSAAR